ncbi:7TM-DISM domain-containing protein [Ekhidna sp.]|uniref:7TM-DISM domain-containing protein n=1 Tax=Ekhidna sp. TaxID=2608089 RepID=UPI003B504C78
MHRFFLFIGFCICILTCTKGQKIALENYINQKKILNDEARMIAVDSTITAERAFKLLTQHDEYNDFNSITPGYSYNNYWILINLETKTKNEVLLEIANAHIDSIEVFNWRNGIINKLFEIGDHYPFNSRPIKTRNFAFPLDLSLSANTYLLRVNKTGSSLNMPLLLWEKNIFKQHDQKRITLQWIFFGLIIAFIISSVVIYLILKDISFALFALYAFFSGLFIFGNYGYAAQHLLTDLPQANDFFRPTVAWCNSIVGIFFFRSFLRINERFPKISFILKAIAIGLIMMICVVYYDVSWTRNHGILILNILILCMISSISLIIWAAVKSYKADRFRVLTFFISSFFAFVGAIVFLFMSYGFVNPTSIDPLSVGLGAELLGFGIALIASVQIKKTSKSFSGEFQSSHLDALIRPFIPKEIEFIKAQDHHCHLHAFDQASNKFIRISIHALNELLPSDVFLQTHRSFIVNAHHIKIKYADKLIMNSGREVPISRSYKNAVAEFLNGSN